MRDREEVTVRRQRARQVLMRRARMRVAQFAVGIAERADDVLLEGRAVHDRRDRAAELEAPLLVLEWIGSCARHAGCRADAGSRDRSALAQEGTPVDETVAGNRLG